MSWSSNSQTSWRHLTSSDSNQASSVTTPHPQTQTMLATTTTFVKSKLTSLGTSNTSQAWTSYPRTTIRVAGHGTSCPTNRIPPSLLTHIFLWMVTKAWPLVFHFGENQMRWIRWTKVRKYSMAHTASILDRLLATTASLGSTTTSRTTTSTIWSSILTKISHRRSTCSLTLGTWLRV